MRKATDDEVNKFHGYVAAIKNYYQRESTPPRVRGLMIAQDYTRRGNDIRLGLEQVADPKLEFKKWDSVLHETEALHVSWLSVSQRRAHRES